MKKSLRRLQNIAFLSLCLTYALFRGSARKTPGQSKKILIIQMAKLGDMVCVTPMFRAVKSAGGKPHLIVVGNSINAELLRGNPDIDDYISCNEEELFYCIKKIRAQKIDYACLTAPNFRMLCALFLAGIPSICVPVVEGGTSPYETRPYRILRKLTHSQKHSIGSYAPREYLRLLEPLGIFSEDTKKHVYYSDESKQKIDRLFERNAVTSDFIVGMSVSVANKIKKWPLENFAKLTHHIQKKNDATIFIIGAKQDAQDVERFLSIVQNKEKIINVSGALSLEELKALISRLNVFISVDTGPIYIAEALSVPTIDIVGPMDEREQPPRGEFNKIVVAKRKAAELHIMNARQYDEKEARRQVLDITVEMVTEKYDELVQSLQNCVYKVE